MRTFRHLSARPELLVDHLGNRVADVSAVEARSIVGFADGADHTVLTSPGGERLVYALPTNISGGDLSLRYRPPFPPDDVCVFGMDFSAVIAVGVGIDEGQVTILTNTVPPADDGSWTIGPVTVRGRAVYATLSGGVTGTDYQIEWRVGDTSGNFWSRTALCLCAPTS